jgi:hypothetical protein
MKIITSILILMFSSLAFSAQWIDKSGKRIPDSNSVKSSKDFIAQLILTTNEQELFKKWATPSQTVNVSTSEVVERNNPISAFIIFGGCAVDSHGKCNLVASFKVYQPDGKIYANTPEMEVWIDKPIPPNRTIELSVAYLKIVIENGELLGKYRIQANVTDKNSDQYVILTNEFKAIEGR